jgi:2-C-methyl-D-erythritol 2,4-cyclodiphosphate synthase
VSNIRVGFGFDTHAFQSGLPLWLGGVQVPFEKGSKGHSDADVLLHAICDALLGASALGDIGTHFPDTDPQYKGIASEILVKRTMEKVQSAGFTLVNIDTTLCLEKPVLKPFIPEIQKRISEILEIPCDRVSVKAKTSERLGFIGRGEGLSAYAVVLLELK